MVSIKWVLFLFTLYFISSVRTHNDEQLDKFNQIFLKAYQEKRNKLIETFDPLIITTGGEIILIRRGQNITFSSTPRLYHNLKTISHVPLTIFVFLLDPSSNDRNLTAAEITFLKAYLAKIHRMKKLINVADFSSDEEVFQRQQSILDASIQYLRFILRSKHLNGVSLQRFCQEAQRLFSKNFALAARSQLDEMHSRIYPWYHNHLNGTERLALRVLIIGPKTAREGFVITQYLEKLLGGHPLQSKRILYVENLPEIPVALNILSTWILDQHAAVAFFQDDTRLHRDLMKNNAADYIKELFR